MLCQSKRRTLYVVGGWVILGICCLPIDLSLSHAMLNGLMPGELRSVFHRGEIFGHAYGVLAIMISIYVLDPARRGKLWHLAACFLAAGLTADLIKLQVWRTRPRAYWEEHLSGSTFLGSIWTSDRLDWSSLLNHTHHSFPSAHTAVAVAVAMSLSRLYPLGRYWFMFLAGLCAMNRIDGGAHFASDVCWGAAVGYLIATVMPSPDRMETWMLRGGAKPTKSTAEERLGKAA